MGIFCGTTHSQTRPASTAQMLRDDIVWRRNDGKQAEMRMRGALCLSPLRFSSKFQLRPLVVVGVFNFTDGRKGTPGPIKLLARSRSSPRFHSSRRSAPHATKNTTPRPPLELHRPPLAGSSAASPSRSIPEHARPRIRRADGAGAGDLAAAGGPRHHRRHHPLHHLPLIAPPRTPCGGVRRRPFRSSAHPDCFL